MDIRIIYQDAPIIPTDIREELLAESPRTLLQWNPRYRLESSGSSWEPRWEIWKELLPSRHPDASNQRFESDEWNSEEQCWMRKLQTYETAEGLFAPVDRGLIVGLAMASTWQDRLWYEEFIEKPFDAQEETKLKNIRDISGAAARYYHGIPNPIVGRHFNSGWRHGTL